MSFHSVVIQKLLSTNAHLGRRVTEHHFKIFSEGARNSISIIDSDKTLICIRNACNFIGQLARNNARFLFVNTNSLFDEIISQMTEITKIKNDTTWRLGGFLTNSSSPKKFRGRNKKFNLGAVQAPDCIVIFDSERKSSVVREADKLQIPVVGLVDSSMPWDTYKKITYPVPANDSVEFVYLFCNLMTKTILKEQKRALAEAGEPTREDDQQNDQTVMKDKFFVCPYENLLPVSEDMSETLQLLNKLVVLKFNGIFGDKMGFKTPKCVMEIGHGLTCLDLIVNQIDGLNVKYGCDIPLILVNEMSAHDGIMKVLAKNSTKKIHVVTMSQSEESTSKFVPPPAKGEDDKNQMSSLNLAKVFLELASSGKLDIMLSEGKEYILMLSSDNLAHVVDTKILNHLIRNNIEYCVEVMPTRSSEREGNDILQKKEDFKTPLPKNNWKFIDTMWINMNSIGSLVARRAAREDLTISKLFDESLALSVAKSRYLPVEATSDLLLLKSDLYTLVDGILTRNTTRENPTDPSIELGPEFENVNDFHRRFKSIPSVVGLDSLQVTGDVWFGAGITLKGKVNIHARLLTKIVIPDKMVLENTVITSQGDIEGGSL